jgi:hypothetical protein
MVIGFQIVSLLPTNRLHLCLSWIMIGLLIGCRPMMIISSDKLEILFLLFDCYNLNSSILEHLGCHLMGLDF